MLNILKSDLYKLRKSKAFHICTFLCAALAVFMLAARYAEMNRTLTDPNSFSLEYVEMMLEISQQASGIWVVQDFLPMGFHIILVGIFVAIFISSEFSFGTIKNILSRGAGRIQVFLSKFIVCSIASLAMLFAFVIATLTTGSIIWGLDPYGVMTLSGVLNMMSLQALLMVAFTAFFTFVSMTMRSNGGAIATNIMCFLVASMLLSAISALFGGVVDLSQYWLTTSVSSLATLTPESGDVIQGLIVAFVWGIGSILVGTTLFKIKDVK